MRSMETSLLDGGRFRLLYAVEDRGSVEWGANEFVGFLRRLFVRVGESVSTSERRVVIMGGSELALDQGRGGIGKLSLGEMSRRRAVGRVC